MWGWGLGAAGGERAEVGGHSGGLSGKRLPMSRLIVLAQRNPSPAYLENLA